MAENTRNTRLALMEETTEGTPVLPAAGTDFIALQDGFSLEPNFQVLSNAEIASSIGKKKPVLGLEEPKASFKHYLRHSGVEGQAPGFRKLLKAAFGSETVVGTEDVTVSSSTATDVKVGSGKGADFQRGQSMLVKDGANGYSIRPVLSVAGDDITPGFALPAAPGSGIGLGKPAMYSVLQTGHPSLTVTEYRANAGAIEVISGVRVTEFSFDAQAGEMIDASYSLDGIKYYFDPINVTTAKSYLDFLDNATTRVVQVARQLYRDPVELAQAIQDAMNALGSANTFTVTYNSSGASAGKFTIVSNGSTLTLKWNTGTNTANSIASLLGFSTAADSSGALTYTSTTVQSWAASLVPSYDSADPVVAKDGECLLGGASSSSAFKPSKVSFKMSTPKSNLLDITSSSGISGSVISSREIEVQVSGYLTRHDVDSFKRFRNNDDTGFLFNAGVKSGGNWVAGKCFSLYLPDATISSYKLGDDNGLVTLELTLKAYVDSNGDGEVYLNFV